MRIFKFFKKSKGFTLVEISIVLLIASILMIGYTRVLRDINQDDKSAAIAAHLVTVTGGVNTYISSNFNALVAGTAITGVANPLAPTVTELKTTGYLAQNVKTTNLAGTNWLTQINLTPAGCVAPACDLNAIVYSDKGFFNLSTNKPDWMLASRVAGKVGGEGATSLYSNTTVISGEGGTWTTPNPVAAANAAAVVAMRTGYGSQGFSQFVRNGDMRNITLNGNLGVNGASGVSATKEPSPILPRRLPLSVAISVLAGTSLLMAALPDPHYVQLLSLRLGLHAPLTDRSRHRLTARQLFVSAGNGQAPLLLTASILFFAIPHTDRTFFLLESATSPFRLALNMSRFIYKAGMGFVMVQEPARS